MTIIKCQICHDTSSIGNLGHCHPFQELYFLDLSFLSGSMLESVSERDCAWFGRLNGRSRHDSCGCSRGMDEILKLSTSVMYLS